MTTYKVKTPSGWVYIDSQNYDSRYILASSKGNNSGVASLDESGHVIFEQLPSSITGAVNYQGVFDPSEGAPTPAAQGYYYVSSGVGTVNATSFATGDWLVYIDESTWDKIANSSASVTWNNVSQKPAEFAPLQHDNEAHSSTFITSLGVTYEALNNNGDVGDGSTQVAAGDHEHDNYQPIDGDLTSIAGLSGSSGLLRKTSANTYTLDTNTYLTELTPVLNATRWDGQALPSIESASGGQVLALKSDKSALEFATIDLTTLGGASKTASDLTIYVYEDAVGTGDGSSKVNGFTTLQAAIDAIPDVAQNVTIIVSKGSTNYLGDTTTIQKASVKSLTIQGEFYAYEACDANAVAGKVVDASADFSDFEVGDRVVCTKYSGTVGSSSIEDYFYATITEVGEGYVQTSEETKVPTTGWRYLINQTQITSVNDSAGRGFIESLGLYSFNVNGITLEVSGGTGNGRSALRIAGGAYGAVARCIFLGNQGLLTTGQTTFTTVYNYFNSTYFGIQISHGAQGDYHENVCVGSPVTCIYINAGSQPSLKYNYLNTTHVSGKGVYSTSPNCIPSVSNCYIGSNCVYGAYGYNITLIDCTNNAATPVTNLTSGGSIDQWDGYDLPSVLDASGGQVLRLTTDKSAFEFATVTGGGGVTEFIQLSDTPNVYGPENVGKFVRVNALHDGLEFASVPLDYMFKASPSDGTPGYLRGKLIEGSNITITLNPDVGSGETITIAASGGGSGSFIGLSDTPAIFGLPGQVPIINETSDALEFATLSGGDSLPSQTGNAGKFLTTDGTDASWEDILTATTFASGDAVVTLPGTPSVGQIFEYVGTGQIWTINANTGQTIRVLGDTGNTLTAGHAYACVGLVYIDDNVWVLRSQVGTASLTTV